VLVAREHSTHLSFLEALFATELEERERKLVERRIHEAHLTRMNTLEEFDFLRCPTVRRWRFASSTEGGYIERAEPVIFISDSGTGKTHRLTGLAVAACRQKRRVPLRHRRGISQRVGRKPSISYNWVAHWRSPAVVRLRRPLRRPNTRRAAQGDYLTYRR
jgi:DNA replication protein DnaC